MPRFLLLPVLGFVLAAVTAPARAELPSLMSDKGERGAGADPQGAPLTSVFRGFDAWRRGQLYFKYLGAVDYRWSGRGLRAGFHYAGAAARALIGYDGEQRLELEWLAQGGSIRLAYVDEDGTGGYRIEFVQDF